MAELAVTDGMPPPADLPRGQVVCTRLPDGSLRIDHADPRILISAALLDTIAASPDPRMVLDTAACCDCFMYPDYTEAVLKISAINRQVIYRITRYVPAVRGYIGQWPD